MSVSKVVMMLVAVAAGATLAPKVAGEGLIHIFEGKFVPLAELVPKVYCRTTKIVSPLVWIPGSKLTLAGVSWLFSTPSLKPVPDSAALSLLPTTLGWLVCVPTVLLKPAKKLAVVVIPLVLVTLSRNEAKIFEIGRASCRER